MKPIKALNTQQFASGCRIKGADLRPLVPPLDVSENQEFLFVKAGKGYRVLAVEVDIKRVYIEVTTDCNFDCITCIRRSWHDGLEYMEWETFKNLLNQLMDLPQLESVHIGGFGEPMMHPRIFDMLDALKHLDIRVEMITNGSYLTDENIEKLLDLQIDTLFTSFDSPNEERYNKIRLEGDFSHVFDNVSRLTTRKQQRGLQKPELGIEFVAMKSNLEEISDLIKMAQKLKVSQIIISNLIPYSEAMKDEIVYVKGESKGLEAHTEYLTSVWASLSEMELRTDRYCKFVNDQSLTVNCKGYVSPCYQLMHEYDCYIFGRKKHMHPCYVGNVNERELKDLWTDRGYLNFRRVVKENQFPSCTDCPYQEGCNYTESNEMDCWGNSPSCGECLWARRIIACP